eukprot:jgi/Phyca11/537156/estExt2_fgenesh1_pg.C_PHYCAscaffold_760023
MGSDLPWLMQIVPANVFAQHSANISTRAMYVGSVGSELDTEVIVVNEALVVGNMIKALNSMDEHKLTIAFFEAYDVDRKMLLQDHELQEATSVSDDAVGAEEVVEKKTGADNVTQLPIAVYACYLRSLFARKNSAKIYNDEYSNVKTLFDERQAYQDAIYLTKSGTEGLSLGDAVLVSSAPALSKDAEAELLNMMLWEMLKHRHAVPSLVQVLDLMEAVGSKGGALALRKTVFALFEYDVKQKNKSPREAVENSVKFWGEHSSVLNGQGFLVHLLLEECVKHHWDDACDVLVDYLLDGGVSRLPINSIINMMGTNEVRGRFEANANLGEKLLEKLSRNNIAKLRDDFYERYLMSYLRLERFDEVGQQYVKLNLKKRFPHNEVIRTVVQDAAAQLVDDAKPGAP